MIRRPTMSKFLDYLLMRTPEATLGAGPRKKLGKPGEISATRLALAFPGLLLGIFFSFYVIGLETASKAAPVNAASQQTARADSPGAAPAATPAPAPRPRLVNIPRKDLPTILVITAVVCMVTFQGLYKKLGLYQNEPAWLVLFVAFEYGYFWQSVIRGGAVLLGAT
jgi:hypothetical protein